MFKWVLTFSITAVGTLDETPTKAQTLPVPIVGYKLLAAVNFKTMLEKLKKELEECKKLWSKYSCDCLHFEMLSLEKRIAELSA